MSEMLAELQLLDSLLWDARDIAALLGVKPDYVTRTLVRRPDFPKDLNLRRMHKRWLPADINAWLESRPGPCELRPTTPRSHRTEPLPRTERVKMDRTPIATYLRAALRQAKKRAIKHQRTMNIGHVYLAKMVAEQGGKCAVSGMPFSLEQVAGSSVRPFAPSIDRVSSALGYDKGNVRLVCHCINLMMNEWGDQVFSRVAAHVRG